MTRLFNLIAPMILFAVIVAWLIEAVTGVSDS